jgi:hypothetical protein
MANFDAFLAPVGARLLARTRDAPGSNLFAGMFFFIAQRKIT